MPDLPAFTWFDPTILAPSFFCRTVNAVAEGDVEYLATELNRHHFHMRELPGSEMYDAHGYRLHLTRAFCLAESALGDGAALIPDFEAILGAEAPRRTSIIIRDADRLIESDVQRAMLLVERFNECASELERLARPIQLLTFLAGPPPSFRPIDEAAKQRARRAEAVKVTAEELRPSAWSKPKDFDLAAHHQLLLSYAAWYYAALGRRAVKSEDRWTCYEDNESLVFVRTEDNRPCFAGVFARMPEGMRLVGVRYESDESVFRMPWETEDPFTFFRRLCETLGIA